MGYTTEFSGALTLSRRLTFAEAKQILEANEDPDTIPNAPVKGYMQWVPTETLDQIVWDGVEKFYDYVPWLRWLCELLGSWGVSANGTLHWSGEDARDTGTITVVDGSIEAIPHQTTSVETPRPLTLGRLAKMALEKVAS